MSTYCHETRYQVWARNEWRVDQEEARDIVTAGFGRAFRRCVKGRALRPVCFDGRDWMETTVSRWRKATHTSSNSNGPAPVPAGRSANPASRARTRAPGLDREVKWHRGYARRNRIHVSSAFMIDGLARADIGSGHAVADRATAVSLSWKMERSGGSDVTR
jgi:hypothetical protein